MTFIPTFRHFRIYNIISLTGTAYSALYLIIAATGEPFYFIYYVNDPESAQRQLATFMIAYACWYVSCVCCQYICSLMNPPHSCSPAISCFSSFTVCCLYCVPEDRLLLHCMHLSPQTPSSFFYVLPACSRSVLFIVLFIVLCSEPYPDLQMVGVLDLFAFILQYSATV